MLSFGSPPSSTSVPVPPTDLHRQTSKGEDKLERMISFSGAQRGVLPHLSSASTLRLWVLMYHVMLQPSNSESSRSSSTWYAFMCKQDGPDRSCCTVVGAARAPLSRAVHVVTAASKLSPIRGCCLRQLTVSCTVVWLPYYCHVSPPQTICSQSLQYTKKMYCVN